MARPPIAGAEEGPLPGEVCRLEVDAIVETKTHVSGIGWRLTGAAKAPIRTQTRRQSRTLIAAELAGVRAGLRDAARRGCTELTVLVPDPRAVALLRGDRSKRYPRAEAAVARLAPLFGRFRSIRFESNFVPDAELAHSVGEALDAGLHSAAEREEHRAAVIERIIERAKEVRLERTDSGWLANGRYHVQLNPMRCDCPAWTVRWARAPIAGRRAQRLPCKHIVALALHEGITVPADLARMARRAPV